MALLVFCRRGRQGDPTGLPVLGRLLYLLRNAQLLMGRPSPRKFPEAPNAGHGVTPVGWQRLGDSQEMSTNLTGFSTWTLGGVTWAHFLVFCLECRWSSSRAGCAGEAGPGRRGDTFPGHPGAPSTGAAAHFVSTGQAGQRNCSPGLGEFSFPK